MIDTWTWKATSSQSARNADNECRIALQNGSAVGGAHQGIPAQYIVEEPRHLAVFNLFDRLEQRHVSVAGDAAVGAAWETWATLGSEWGKRGPSSQLLKGS